MKQDISSTDIQDEKYLKPVLDDDAFIFSLDDLPDATENGEAVGKPAACDAANRVDSVSALRRRNAELAEELERVTRQFDSYRLAVQQTLDQRWGTEDQAESELSKSGAQRDNEKDASEYYWESYAGNGKLRIWNR